MSASAHRGDHDIAFYEARIGFSWVTTTAGAGVPVFVNSDTDGPLQPARYLIHLGPVSDQSVIVWVGFSPFTVGDSPASIAAAGARRIPLGTGDQASAKLVAIETNVLEVEDDRITIESLNGTATVYVTRVSTVVPKGRVA